MVILGIQKIPRKICSHIDLQTNTSNKRDNRDLTFDHRVNTCIGPAMDYMLNNFGADSSRCLPFRAWTDIQTERQTQMQQITLLTSRLLPA